jgi:enamine deaminase RidA (YjgF/YER057c/UK114 family)
LPTPAKANVSSAARTRYTVATRQGGVNMATAEQRLTELGLELPPAPGAVASYEPWAIVGNMLYTSGQLPWRDGKNLLYKGKIGRDLTFAEGYEACRLATLNAIAQLKAALGDLERVRRIVRLEGSLNVAPGVGDAMPKVLNGASELVNAVFGERGRHTRMIYTSPDMPLDTACLIVFWAEFG